MTTWMEYALLLGFFIGYPVWDAWHFPSVKAAVERGEPDARIRLYREIMGVEWVATLWTLALLWIAAVPWAEVGFGAPSGRGGWIAMGLVAFLMVQIVVEHRMIHTRPAFREKVRSGFRRVAAITPTNVNEWRRFVPTAFTAGICEEILYRGFLFWWLDRQLAGMAYGTLAAAVLSCVAFGLAHAYQGAAGILKTGLLGGVFLLIAWLGGSLWPAIVLHVIIDLAGGRMALYMAQEDGRENGNGLPEPATAG